MSETFAATLKTLRQQRKLTIYQLATLAGVPAPLISALQTGSRTVGENNAGKLGSALGLSGADLRDFVYLALNEAAGKVLGEYQHYPAQILNLAAAQLQHAGVAAADIAWCELPHSKDSEVAAPVVVYLKNGGNVLVTVEVVRG